MKTFYYIFRVTDNLGSEYYVLNNEYIGYIGWAAGDRVTLIIENSQKIKRKYQLFAKSSEVNSQSLHELNCENRRLTLKEANQIVTDYRAFNYVYDDTYYKVYHPDKNSTDHYLKEVGGEKVIK